MKKTIIILGLLLLVQGQNAEAAQDQGESFVASGVGGTYTQSIEGMFENARDICAEEDLYADIQGNILTFDVGTFRAVRANFTCGNAGPRL